MPRKLDATGEDIGNTIRASLRGKGGKMSQRVRQGTTRVDPRAVPWTLNEVSAAVRAV
jgi:hypothetical protein